FRSLRPANTAEVAAILKIANEHLVPVVPQSGNTGLAGGASISALQDTIILSTDRMNRILDINPVSRVAKVEAGVVLANLHAAVAQHGLTFPLLFGARGSCMIGGNLSTNAGGSNVVRYGNTRALCLGLEVVTPAG
ncbi:MAG TPA: FAD-binding oxidoreductase, partial [Rhodobacteraceae bacterium]|nr:FAD-binding oxidoreductase [Paracoccaceae bacterium]